MRNSTGLYPLLRVDAKGKKVVSNAVRRRRQAAGRAWVAELTGVLDLTRWPKGMRVTIRAERPHPGAQLTFTDSDGNRLTAFATNTYGGQLADLELRHRRRARCEDRIRNAEDSGLKNLPLKDFAQNQVWVAVVQLATELTAWMQMLAFAGTPARTWEPKKLRYRLLSSASRPGSAAAPAAPGCACPRTHPTATCSWTAWAGCETSHS